MGDIGSTFTGLSGKNKEDFGHGDAQFITYMNVFSNPVANLEMTEAVEIDAKQNSVKKGDVFFTTSSETPEEVGMSCVMPENKDNIYLNSFCFGYRPTEKFDLDYLAYVLRANYFRKEMTFLAQGISRYNISKNKVMEVSIPVPNLEEQTMIGRYFSNIDRLITLHQRKFYLLLKLLHNDWEQRKFGDLGSVAMCKRIFKEQTSTDGDIPFYKIGTFGAEPDAFISRELFKEYREKFQYPNIGDMLISASGTIGRTVEYKGEEAYFQDSNIVWFKHDDRVDNSFLKCIYEIVKWSGIEGSTIKRLYNDNFLKTEFSMPKVAEQQQIGMYFQSLDHLITLHHRKYIDTLKAP